MLPSSFKPKVSCCSRAKTSIQIKRKCSILFWGLSNSQLPFPTYKLIIILKCKFPQIQNGQSIFLTALLCCYKWWAWVQLILLGKKEKSKHTISYRRPSYHSDMARIKWYFKLFQHHVSKESLSSFILLPGIESVHFVFNQKEHLLLYVPLLVTCSCKNEGTLGRVKTKKSIQGTMDTKLTS